MFFIANNIILTLIFFSFVTSIWLAKIALRSCHAILTKWCVRNNLMKDSRLSISSKYVFPYHPFNVSSYVPLMSPHHNSTQTCGLLWKPLKFYAEICMCNLPFASYCISSKSRITHLWLGFLWATSLSITSLELLFDHGNNLRLSFIMSTHARLRHIFFMMLTVKIFFLSLYQNHDFRNRYLPIVPLRGGDD